jgi:uncharacterized metal-binding protein
MRMVDLPKKKVGIVACSGEELPEGTVTRLAALRVLEDLRPNDTVTICVPLFLAGGEGDRAFARFYPTIAIDGCELRCAEKATEKYSNKPAASIMVRDLVGEHKLNQLEGKRHLNAAGLQAVEITAEWIANCVDELLGKQWDRRQGEPIKLETSNGQQPGATLGSTEATCACQSGIPVEKVIIAGKEVAVVGLPLIFQQFTEAGKNPNEENMAELMETIKIYNPIPVDEAAVYFNGIREAYTNYWFKGKCK